MKKILIVLLCCFVVVSCGTGNNVQSDYDETFLEDKEILSAYLSNERAERLLMDTWSGIKSIYDLENLERSDFDHLEEHITEEYIDRLYQLFTVNDSDFRMMSRNLSLPLISDAEVEVVEFKIRELVDSTYPLELLIVEKGVYTYLDIEFTRNNHYTVDKSGDVKLYNVSGELGLRDKTILEDLEVSNSYKLLTYLDIGNATSLLEDTWRSIVDESRTESALFDRQRVIEDNMHISETYISYLLDRVTRQNSSDEIVKVKGLFIPIISDEEMEIEKIEVSYLGAPNMEYELIITEKGSFIERNSVFKRNNHYYVDTNGKLNLYHVSEFLAYGELTRPSNGNGNQ